PSTYPEAVMFPHRNSRLAPADRETSCRTLALSPSFRLMEGPCPDGKPRTTKPSILPSHFEWATRFTCKACPGWLPVDTRCCRRALLSKAAAFCSERWEETTRRSLARP